MCTTVTAEWSVVCSELAAHATLLGHDALLNFAHDHHGLSKAHTAVLEAFLLTGGELSRAEAVNAVCVTLLCDVELRFHHHTHFEVAHSLHCFDLLFLFLTTAAQLQLIIST